MTSDRFRPLTTIHNLRDYGGYATADGGQVKTGLLWRSGHHADASDADLGEVAAIDFADVIDLRGNSERATNTCRRANNFAGEVHFHDGETAGLGLALHEQAGEQAVSEESAFLAMRKLYADLPFRDGLNAILPHYFAILAKGRGPSLVHCAAGKDRTGIAVDLLHHILGVHPDDAMEDYLLTNHAPNNEARIARGMEMIGKKYGNSDEGIARVLMGVDERYLVAARESLVEHFGSINAYLEDRLGVDTAMRDQLRLQLVEG